MDLFPQQPKIQGFVVDGGDGNARVPLLLVETIELFKEIDLGTRGGLDRVEALQTCLETERLERNDALLACMHVDGTARLTSVSVTKGIAHPVGGMILHMP